MSLSNELSIYGDNGTAYASIFEKKMSLLNGITERITDLNNSPFAAMNITRYEIAVGLFRVQTEKLYEVVEKWSNVYDYAGETLHFKKMTTSNYIRVARYYLHKDKPLNIFENDRFSITQLVEMCKADLEEVKAMVTSGTITPDMSVLAIREVIASHNNNKKQAEKTMKEEALLPIKEAHEDFHKAYNRLKEHLIERGDTEGAEEMLPDIMDALVRIYNAKLEVDLPVL